MRCPFHVLTVADEYREGFRTAEELKGGALGCDVSRRSRQMRCALPSRGALFQAEARVDSARFTIDIADQPNEIGKILDDLESVLKAADAHR